MKKSQSVPGLGKGMSPLRGYLGSPPQPHLSSEENEAEQLFYALASATVTKAAFQIYGKDLTRRSSDAGAYLTFLIYRGKFPRVRKGLR